MEIAHGIANTTAISGATNPVSSVILSINKAMTLPINAIIKLVSNNGSRNHQNSTEYHSFSFSRM